MLWTVLALALSTAAAAGPEKALEEDIDFQEGKRLVDELDYERAVFRFQKLTKSDRPAEQRAVVNAWLGLTYANLGDEDEAIKAFVVAIKLDPLVVLPPSSPKVAQIFDKARKVAREEVKADSDGDGIVDGSDRCPSEPETKNGFEDDDGCKDEVPKAAPADGDGDGVADDVDTCKDVKGDAAHAGCPPPPPPPEGPPVLLIGGGVAAGLGVVAVVGGAVAGVLAQQSQEAAVTAVFQDEKQSLKQSADDLALIANVGYGVGAALVVGGVVLAGASFIGGGP